MLRHGSVIGSVLCALATASCGSSGAGGAVNPSFASVLSVARSSSALKGCSAIGQQSHPVGLVAGLVEWNDVTCTGRLGTDPVIAWYRFTDAATAAQHLSDLHLSLAGAPYLVSGSVVVQPAPDNGPSAPASSPAIAGLTRQISAVCRCGNVRMPAGG